MDGATRVRLFVFVMLFLTVVFGMIAATIL